MFLYCVLSKSLKSYNAYSSSNFYKEYRERKWKICLLHHISSDHNYIWKPIGKIQSTNIKGCQKDLGTKNWKSNFLLHECVAMPKTNDEIIKGCTKNISKNLMSTRRYGSNLEIFGKNITKEEMNSRIASCVKRFREFQRNKIEFDWRKKQV